MVRLATRNPARTLTQDPDSHHSIIHQLPPEISNKIAAGEVIQRPSSVVKELVDNAIDAGADQLKIVIQNAGRTLIQVVDNGCGMGKEDRSEEHTSELQSRGHLVCRLLLEKKK